MRGPRSMRTLTVGVGMSALALAACGSSNNSTSSSSSSGGGNTPTGVVKIGGIFDQTGPFAGLGQATLGGLKTAAADINKTGFMVGGTKYTFDITSVDSQSTTAGATAAVTQIASDDSIQYVFGPDPSAEAVAVQTALNKYGALFFTQSGTVANNLLAQGVSSAPNSLTFAISATAATWGKYIADAIHTQYPDVKTASITCSNLASQQPYVTGTVQELQKFGITVPSDQIIQHDPTATDYTAILTKIKAYHPDIYIEQCDTTGTVTTVAKQMTQLGGVSKIGMATIGAGASVALKDAVGGPLPFSFVFVASGYPAPDVPGNPLASYLAHYQEVNGAAAPASTLSNSYTYYAPLQALAAAMTKAGTVSDPAKIAAALGSISAKGPAGTLSFDSNHIANLPFTYCDVTNGTVSCKQVPGSGT